MISGHSMVLNENYALGHSNGASIGKGERLVRCQKKSPALILMQPHIRMEKGSMFHVT